MTDPCSSARLEAALAGNLPADDEASLCRHLEECEECSAAIERLAGGASWCQEAAALLTGDELDDAVPVGEAWSETDFTVEHLEPADEPNLLGRLGGYDVLEILGRGGMGVVLKGYDRELKRCVAIKVLAPHLAHSSLARKRFAREAQAAAAVVHANVLAIHQVQPSGRLPFLVMPLVAGESLGERLAAQGTLELKEILRIGMQAAAGLAAAHEQGLVHRDVKPANILLEKGVERAVLTDFGLACAADDVALTQWGIVAGTPQYMSPEQARGEPLDGRSDLFSLGCVLYEMATGVSPFRADSTMATMRRLVDDAPQAMASFNPELPPWFIAIVGRLLEKDPSRRFGSAKEVSELLEGCLAHLQQPASVPLPAALPGPVPQPDSGRRRSRFKGVIAMFATLGIILLGAFGWVSSEPPDIAGQWTGEDWGTVILKKTSAAEYTGTYTDTFGKEPGEIHLKWSRIERRFNGTWSEGQAAAISPDAKTVAATTDRFGELSVRLVNNEIRGAFTTDAKSKINPATPRLADLTWKRTDQLNSKSQPDKEQSKPGGAGGKKNAGEQKAAVPMEQFTGRIGDRQGDSVAVTFDVDERSFLRYQRLLREHQVKGPGSPIYLGFTDEDGFPHQGTLKGFNDRIDPRTGTVKALGILRNPDRLFLPGMFVRVRMPFGKTDNKDQSKTEGADAEKSAKVHAVEAAKLLGTWHLQRTQKYGKDLAPANDEELKLFDTLTFTNKKPREPHPDRPDELDMLMGSDEGTYSLDPKSEPSKLTMRFFLTYRCIYLVKGVTLIVCCADPTNREKPRNSYPDRFETAPGSERVLRIYRRVPEKKTGGTDARKETGERQDTANLSSFQERALGTWQLQRTQKYGKDLAPARDEELHETLTFTKNRVLMGKRGVDAFLEGTYKLDPRSDSRMLTVQWLLEWRCIYRLDGDTLTICYEDPYNRENPLYPDRFESAPGSERVLRIYQRKAVKNPQAEDDLKKLEGTWELVSRIEDGKVLAAPEGDKPRLIIRDGRYTYEITHLGATRAKTGTMQFDPIASPKTVDIVYDRTGLRILGIYELKGDELRICAAGPRKDRPRTIEAREGSGQSIETWKRLPAKEKQAK